MAPVHLGFVVAPGDLLRLPESERRRWLQGVLEEWASVFARDLPDEQLNTLALSGGQFSLTLTEIPK